MSDTNEKTTAAASAAAAEQAARAASAAGTVATPQSQAQSTQGAGLLKFITCGSVDDGKSTLIGHMLYDSKLIFADQKQALILDSKTGSRGGAIDYSLLLDGLAAEREQGITIDVAYRYFTTSKRSFIVADTPGHEEYTRNMAVGASFAQLAVILIDATKGVLVQTRRHARICKLMGIKHFVFAVNKMDLAGYSEKRFDEIRAQIGRLVEELALDDVTLIPVSATEGDNITTKSDKTPWYQGLPLLAYLEQVDVSDHETGTCSYLPVQRVCRPNHEFRGFQGQVEHGSFTVGDELTVLPSGQKAHVKLIYRGLDAVERVVAGQAANIQLDREVDVSRGCVLTDNPELPVSDAVEATLLWMDDEPLEVGREYLLKLGTAKIPATVDAIAYKVDVNTGAELPATRLSKNEIARCRLSFDQPVVVDRFSRNKVLGELILIDRVSHMTAAGGVVERVVERDEDAEKPGSATADLRLIADALDRLAANPDPALTRRVLHALADAFR